MSNKNKYKNNKRKDKQPNVLTNKEKPQHKTAQIPAMPDDYVGKRIYNYIMQVDTPKSVS